MKKSAYSLILSDGVIGEIDKVAYTMNTSRSNLINQILADYVSYKTPEKSLKEVFDSMEALFLQLTDFKFMLQPSDSMISVRSSLAYKYNPSLKYSVELFKCSGFYHNHLLGELRVSLRTQNSSLILYIMQFFKLWAKIEAAYIGSTDYAIEDGRYLRKLYINFIDSSINSITNDDLGKIVAEYIRVLDKGVKVFFDNLNNPREGAIYIESLYKDYLVNQGRVIIN